MYRYFFTTGTFLFCFTLTLFCLCQISNAQIEEEMAILQMFYKEKELVVSPTRHPKHISQVAENITVVTAKEIEEMNAHTVAEVLSRTTGLFVNYNQDFGASSLVYIQGSEPRHVLVLVDGITWNFLSEGSAETNSIPVGIIERIEVIKGPASSAWGSSLGGVINIITKEAGNTKRPAGCVSASYGEKNTQDYRAQISGRAGPAGYYLFAGRQDSDGLRYSRYFDNYSLYSKFNIPISRDVDVDLSIGYCEPHIGLGDFPSWDITSTGVYRTFFSTASLDASLTREFSFKVSFHQFKQKFIQMNNHIKGLEPYVAPGELCKDITYDEKTTGGSGSLVWRHGMHTAVLGVDYDDGKLDQMVKAGPLFQRMGAQPTTITHPEIERWALYANDTIVIDRWSITPGIRYDNNSATGSFVSPSLGITYRLDEDSILRASMARGFTVPPLLTTSGGGLFLDPNPDLEPEEVWSYQAGVESAVARYLWVKATVFHHDLENALAAGPPPLSWVINKGKIRRQGVELEAETVSFYNLSLLAGAAYVDIDPPNDKGSNEMYAYNIGVRYDDKKSFRAQLFGRYVNWDLDPIYEADYDDFIWDLNLNKKIYAKEKTATELFLTAHNIFNGSQYTHSEKKNPERWLEAGIRVKF